MSETNDFQVSISDPRSKTTHEREHEHLKRVSPVFYRKLCRLIDSSFFELDVFLSFLQEVAIFSELMVKNEGFEDLPIIWQFNR